MRRKLIKVGSSSAVTIPKESLDQLGLKEGDEVMVEVDRKSKKVTIQAAQKLSRQDRRIAELTLDFVERYRADLEALAGK